MGASGEILYGLHPIEEALSDGGRSVERILVARERGTARLGRLLRLARSCDVPVSYVPRKVLAKLAERGAVHQGVLARVSALPYVDADGLCEDAAARPDGILVVLDRVEDPRNLGSVIRCAAAAGASGVLVGTEGAVGLTAGVAKSAAGALERIPVARDSRLAARLRRMGDRGFRVLALHPRAGTPWDQVDLRGRIILAAGGEGRGLRRGLVAASAARVRVPLARGVESLNVSVAVAVVLFEAVRQRRRAPDGKPSKRGT